ncbi:MAG: hypothetical protein V3R68_08480 [Gammaproteobacteria bacterium]
MTQTRVAIGLVGYYQFIRGYPLGPELRERLDEISWHEIDVNIKEMNWGPIAIVQDFQASSIPYDRIVLVAGVDRGMQAGSVTCRHWLGGKLDDSVVQDRIFEAVTGVINLDNLLVIGEHFNIWPEELITIEVQLADSSFGDFVLSELEVNRDVGEARIVGENPLTADVEKVVEQAVTMTQTAATEGVKGLANLMPLTIEQLTPLAEVCHNQLLADCRAPTRQH